MGDYYTPAEGKGRMRKDSLVGRCVTADFPAAVAKTKSSKTMLFMTLCSQQASLLLLASDSGGLAQLEAAIFPSNFNGYLSQLPVLPKDWLLDCIVLP